MDNGLPATMTPREIAAQLQLEDERAFFSKRPRLTRDHNFPRALPGVGLRWSRALVMEWIAANGAVGAGPAPSPEAARKAAPLDIARRRLERRYQVGDAA